MRITYIGGPTCLIEIAGLRLVTDPTFDPGGGEYRTPASTLRKVMGPAIAIAALGHVDAVLLSHDHHADNLDTSGRELLARAATVLTTVAGAERLGGHACGLQAWQSHELTGGDGATLSVTATPARHGPAGGDRGPVIGFVLEQQGRSGAVYVSGDTVWFEGVAEVARRFDVSIAILNMGAARVAAAGPSHLTFTAEEGVAVARACPAATIVPLHFEGWAHFSENRMDVDDAFEEAGLAHRLLWLQPGVATNVPLPA